MLNNKFWFYCYTQKVTSGSFPDDILTCTYWALGYQWKGNGTIVLRASAETAVTSGKSCLLWKKCSFLSWVIKLSLLNKIQFIVAVMLPWHCCYPGWFHNSYPWKCLHFRFHFWWYSLSNCSTCETGGGESHLSWCPWTLSSLMLVVGAE